MRKVIILLMMTWVGIAVLFPNKNKSVEIKEINYTSVFNDLNPVQLNAAKSFGIDQPLKNRATLNDVKGGLVKIMIINIIG